MAESAEIKGGIIVIQDEMKEESVIRIETLHVCTLLAVFEKLFAAGLAGMNSSLYFCGGISVFFAFLKRFVHFIKKVQHPLFLSF